MLMLLNIHCVNCSVSHQTLSCELCLELVLQIKKNINLTQKTDQTIIFFFLL